MLNRTLLSYFGLRPTGDFGPWTFYTNKQGIPVWFLKAPPTKPPTGRQRYLQVRMRDIANAWIRQTEQTKINWEKASKRAGLGMTGYNLWQWWFWIRDRKKLATVERQSGIDLLPQQ